MNEKEKYIYPGYNCIKCHCALLLYYVSSLCDDMLSVIMLNVIILNVIMLNVIILNVIILSVIKLNVIMLSVIQC